MPANALDANLVGLRTERYWGCNLPVARLP